MNTRFKLAFICYLGQKNLGFALVISLSVGLVLLGIGLTMIMRSQHDNAKVFAQQEKAKSLTAAERGITHIQNLLNQNRLIATYSSHCLQGNNDCWANIDPTEDSENMPEFQHHIAYAPSAICQQPESAQQRQERLESIVYLTQSEENALNTWVKVGQNSYYRLISYEYKPDSGKGIVIVEGLQGQEGSESRSRVRVEIPIVEAKAVDMLTQETVPGLWLQRGAVNQGTLETSDTDTIDSGQKFHSHILLSDCNLTPSLLAQIKEQRIYDPSEPANGYDVQVINVDFPTPPNIPDNAIYLDANALSFTEDDGEKVIVFPREEDGTRDVYEYVIDQIDLKGNQVITIEPGQKVTFFVNGNIDIGQTAALQHNCTGISGCQSTNFKIYGLAQDSTPGIFNDNPYINLSGNTELDAFILAPNYDAGINGGGSNQDAVLRGSLWVNTWSKRPETSSNSSHVAILQTAKWTELPESVTSSVNTVKLGSISSWQEQSLTSP